MKSRASKIPHLFSIDRNSPKRGSIEMYHMLVSRHTEGAQSNQSTLYDIFPVSRLGLTSYFLALVCFLIVESVLLFRSTFFFSGTRFSAFRGFKHFHLDGQFTNFSTFFFFFMPFLEQWHSQ